MFNGEVENAYTVYIILNGLFGNPTSSFISQILCCLLCKTCKYSFLMAISNVDNYLLIVHAY